MNDALDPLLFHDALHPAEQEALRAALREDPALARAFAQWQALRGALHARLEAEVPDRSLLVQYALAEHGYADTLSEAEAGALAEARPSLARALAAYPALADVVQRIGMDARAFDAAWAEHGPAITPAPAHLPLAADRPAVQRARVSRRVLWRAATMFALLAFAVMLTLVVRRDAGLTSVATAPGQTRLVTLADGSTVRLLGGSRLRYREGETFDRRTRLEGRAFFDVMPGKGRFTVQTAGALATVLGTSFGVQASDDRTEVVLATGRLSLAPADAPARAVVLTPGQVSRVAPGEAPSAPANVNLTDALAWSGLLVFHETPMARIAERIGARYGASITVAPALVAEPVSGSFSPEQPLPEVLATLAATLGAEVQRTPQGVYRLAPAQ